MLVKQAHRHQSDEHHDRRRLGRLERPRQERKTIEHHVGKGRIPRRIGQPDMNYHRREALHERYEHHVGIAEEQLPQLAWQLARDAGRLVADGAVVQTDRTDHRYRLLLRRLNETRQDAVDAAAIRTAFRRRAVPLARLRRRLDSVAASLKKVEHVVYISDANRRRKAV